MCTWISPAPAASHALAGDQLVQRRGQLRPVDLGGLGAGGRDRDQGFGHGRILPGAGQAQAGRESAVDVVKRLCEDADIPHGQVQVSSIADLEARGFTVDHDVSDGEVACHHPVVFKSR